MGSLSIVGFTVLAWSLTGVATILSIGRFILRQRTTAKLQWDDAFHAFALVCLIVLNAIATVIFTSFLKQEFFITGQGPEPSLSVLTRYTNIQRATTGLWWVCIYSIKFSFLLFYRKIFNVSQTFLKAWWVVLAYTFLTFWACIGGTLATCAGASTQFNDGCSPTAINFQTAILDYECVLNVSSDLAIMALPLYMLKGLQMPISRKVGLGCLFCLAFVGIAFDIIRTVYDINGGTVVMATVWNMLEAEFAIIISCLPTYRSLFSIVQKREVKRYKNIAFSSYNKNGKSPPCPSFGKTRHGSPSQQDLAESVHLDTWPSVSYAEAHEVVSQC